jgi:N-acetylglucosaminyl-diphospho-decaprenol L-rhamnosyltransferase
MTTDIPQNDTCAVVTVSLVSHGHGRMVADVLHDLAGLPQIAHVVLTLNVPEVVPAIPEEFRHRMTIIENPAPKGFAANHNAAFRHCGAPFFCVLNPDIRIHENPFPDLLALLGRQEAALAVPMVVNSSGAVEDSVRHFPTPAGILRKALGSSRGNYAVVPDSRPFVADWAAGMFMLFRQDAYRALEGFDEGFFLYYEDVDICVRAWKQGLSVNVCPSAAVVHDARRESHRSLRFMRWHLASMLRFILKHYGRLPDTKTISA